VKDIKVADEQKENKLPPPQNVPNDPAILVSRLSLIKSMRLFL